MKPCIIPVSYRFIPLVGAVVLLLSMGVGKAQILLTIDDSNPAAVVITATGNDASLPGMATSTSASINDGIDLLNFLVGNTTIPLNGIPVTSSNLTSGNLTGTGPDYNSWAPDAIDSPGAPDLTLYSSSSGTEIFTTTSAAFTGTLTVDLTGEPLPSAGSVGTIVTGFSADSPNNTPIGEWKVESVSAPEPSSWILLLVGFGVVIFWRSRPKALRHPGK
jgi:hypothetical protein